MKMNENQLPVANWKDFWFLIREAKTPKWILLLAIVLSLLETAAGLIVPLLTMSLVDQTCYLFSRNL